MVNENGVPAGMDDGATNANLFSAAGTTLTDAVAVGMPTAKTESVVAPALVRFEKRKVCRPLSAAVKVYWPDRFSAVEPAGVKSRSTVPRKPGTGLPRASTAVTVTEVLSPAAICVGAKTVKPTAPPVRLSYPGELNHASTWPAAKFGLLIRMSTVPLPSASTAATVLLGCPKKVAGNASVVVSPKRPSPRPSCTWPVLPVTRSGMPSPLKSAVAWLDRVTPAAGIRLGAGKVPLPLLSQSPTTFVPVTPARSMWPSPLKSAATGETMVNAYVVPACKPVPACPLNTFPPAARSVMPSPLKSPAARFPGAPERTDDEKLPPLAFVKTDTVLEERLLTAKSGRPSPLKSPTATDWALDPTVKVRGAWTVPSPFPSSTLTEPVAGDEVK